MLSHDPLALYMAIDEVADELELKSSSVRRMITDDDDEKRLPSRAATADECAALLAAKRIKGVLGTGIRLIHQNVVAKAKQRRKKRGRPPQIK